MARPKKTGLDYFALDVDFFSNFKVKKITKALGSGSASVLIFLLCEIYRIKGYYIEIDEELSWFASDTLKVSEDYVYQVIYKAVDVNFFDKSLFEKKILTSTEIQSRWIKVCKDAKRSGCEISKEFRVSSGNTTEETELTTEETRLTPDKTGFSTEESTQSIVKESKGKESIISENDFIDIWKRARLHYDKKPTGLDKLELFEKSLFEQLKFRYSKKEFEQAVAGLFFQDTYPNVRIRPDHFLRPEHFTKYLDCWQNKTKMFDNKAAKSSAKFNIGDV